MRRFLTGVVLVSALVLAPAVAQAQTTGTATPSPSPTDVPQVPAQQVCSGTPVAGGGFGPLSAPPKYLVPDGNGGFQLEDSMHACSLAGQQQVHDAAKAFQDGIIPDRTGSKIPMSAYDLGYAAGVAGTIFGVPMAFMFAASVWIVSAGLLLLSWAMEFPFASIGGRIANEVSQRLLTRVIGPVGLGHFALLILAAVAMVFLFRGKPGRALVEEATAIIALLLAGFIVSNPGAVVRTGFKVQGQATSSLLSLSSDKPSSGDALASLKATVVDIDIAQPYYRLNWGTLLTGRCKAVADEALSLGPWGDASAPRDTMAKLPECQAAAKFNASTSPARTFSALVVLGNAVISTVFFDTIGFVLLIAELAFVGLFGVAVLAVIAALLPGPLRSPAFRWLEAVLRVLVVSLIAAFVLGLWALIMTSLMAAMSGAPLWLLFLGMAALSGLSLYLFVSALKRAPHIARSMTKTVEKREGWVPARKSHGGAFGLGLGMGGAEVLAASRKVRRLMPGTRDFRISGQDNATLAGLDEHRAIHDGRGNGKPSLEPYSFPAGPGALSTTVYQPYGDGKWHPDAQHVKADRKPPRTDYATTRDAMREAQNLLANPLSAQRVRLPDSNPRKILQALPVGGSTSDAPVREWESPEARMRREERARSNGL